MARTRLALTVGALGVTMIAVAAGVGWWVLRDDSASKKTAATPRSSAPRKNVQPPAPTSPPCNAASVIATWPLEQRVAQLLMVGVDPRNGHEASDIVARYGVGGVFIGGDATGIFRGGSLGRLSSPAAGIGLERGRQLRDVGVTMDLAPVADVSNQGNRQVIGDRSFGNDADVVTEYAGAFAAGLREAGVIPVLKHFPGHGHATGDSHRQAAVTPPLGDLEAVDLVPYRRLLAEPQFGVMIGHLDVPGLTAPNEPASVSPSAVDDLLRTQLGYGGFVITDDLSEMEAIRRNYGVPEAARRALAAGGDMALFVDSAQLRNVLQYLADAVRSNRLDEAQVNQAVLRVLAVKAMDPCRPAPQ